MMLGRIRGVIAVYIWCRREGMAMRPAARLAFSALRPMVLA